MGQQKMWPLIVAVGMFAALPAAFAAPVAPAAGAPAAGGPGAGGFGGRQGGAQANRLRGSVVSVDGNTITVQGRGAAAPVALTVTSATTYQVDGLGAMSDITAGETVRVISAPPATDATPPPAGTTAPVMARTIQVVPAGQATGAGGGGGFGGRGGAGGGFGGRGGGGGFGGMLTGTVAAAPAADGSFTLTTPDTKTVTVQTNAVTQIFTTHAGTLADVTTGKNIDVTTSGTATAPVAVTVHVRSSAMGGFGGGRGGAGGGRGGRGGRGGAGGGGQAGGGQAGG